MLIPNKELTFKYLDGLRASGVTNMFGAAPYLEREFGMSKEGARDTLTEWMKTFEERSGSDPEFLTES